MSGYNGSAVRRARQLVAATYAPVCWLCGQPITARDYTVDHLVPRQYGGTDDLDNLAPAHRSCNIGRGNRTRHLDKRRKPLPADGFTPVTSREW